MTVRLHPLPSAAVALTIPAMAAVAVIAHQLTPTNLRLGPVLSPGRALTRLHAGDVALARLDVQPSLDGIESGLWALDRLSALGVTVLNPRSALVAAHDKAATADALRAAGVAHPWTCQLAPWLPKPELQPPLVLKPRFGSWGRDVIRCETQEEIERALAIIANRRWYQATGAIAQKLVAPRGYDLRLIVANGQIVGAVRRIAAPGEWRTNVSLGARREPVSPPAEAREQALAAAAAIGAHLVGVDLLPADLGTWVVLEVNGAADFTTSYSLDTDIYAATTAALAA